ncbi:MAG: hypothetical protein PVG07_12135, partial [Acidobacteriota bacterium]
MPVPPVAFGCSASGLSFAGFEREGDGLVLTEHRAWELEETTFQHGLLGGPPREPEELQERVVELVRELGTPVQEASLVLPDAWLRTAFTEVANLPKDSKGRNEVLRWKLKRLVPFRVDELRVRGAEVAPLADQKEPHRLLLGFGIEGLFGQLERCFARAGVRIGRIANEGLSAFGALAPEVRTGDEGSLTGLTLASERGYTLVVSRGDEPVLHRFKTFPDALPETARESTVVRDLRLTRTFLAESFPGEPLRRMVLAAPESSEPSWVGWLETALEQPVEPLGDQHTVPVRLGPGVDAPPRHELLPLVGAVCQEVD